MRLGIVLIIAGITLLVANLWAGTENMVAVYVFPLGLVLWGALRIRTHFKRVHTKN